MRPVLIGCSLAVLLAASAGAQDARTWLFNFDSDTAVLQYGTPESDDAVLVISCEPARKRIQINVAADALVPGNQARLKLSNGAASVDYAGQAVASEMDGGAVLEV